MEGIVSGLAVGTGLSLIVLFRPPKKAYVKEIHGSEVTVKWAWGGTVRVPISALSPYENH